MSTKKPAAVPSRPWIWQAALGCVLLAVASVWCVKLALSADGPTLTLRLGNNTQMELVRISRGDFLMGSPATEKGHDPSESPQHRVTIDQAFYMGKYEVTQAQWMAVMGNQSQFTSNPNQPAECVAWIDAQKWCAEISKRTGRIVRLPSEAEWEYACRAGTTTVFNTGDTISTKQANFNGLNSYGNTPAGEFRQITTPVGSFPPNAFGLCDMHGNVWEWCQDKFHENYNGAPTDQRPWLEGGVDPVLRVYRGGAWDNSPENVRSALRYADAEDLRKPNLGFRVVVEARAAVSKTLEYSSAPVHSDLLGPDPLKPPRLHYGDAVRILGTIAVVFGHVSDMPLFGAPALSKNWWIANCWDAATRWAVPAYIMLSGALLLDPARGETPRRFYEKRLARIGIPLVFWSAFFMWFSAYYTHWVKPPSAVWRNLMLGEPYMHLHFIFRIAGLYAFTPMMRVFLRHSTRGMQATTVIILLCLSSMDSVMNGYVGTHLSAFARFAPFVGYYLCGYLLRDTMISPRDLVWCWVGLIATIVTLAAGTGLLVSRYGMEGYPSMGMLLYDFLSPIRVIMAVFVWLIFVNHFRRPWPRTPKFNKAWNYWASTTLGLYLVHPVFREFFTVNGWINFRLHPGTWPTLVYIPVLAVMVYIPAFLVTVVLMKIPYVRRITG